MYYIWIAKPAKQRSGYYNVEKNQAEVSAAINTRSGRPPEKTLVGSISLVVTSCRGVCKPQVSGADMPITGASI
jgi:hypothetical protein